MSSNVRESIWRIPENNEKYEFFKGGETSSYKRRSKN